MVTKRQDNSLFYPLFVYRSMKGSYDQAKGFFFLGKGEPNIDLFREMLFLSEQDYSQKKYPQSEEIEYIGSLFKKGKFNSLKANDIENPANYLVSFWTSKEDTEAIIKVGVLGFFEEEEFKKHKKHEFGEMPEFRCMDLTFIS